MKITELLPLKVYPSALCLFSSAVFEETTDVFS